jgi:NADH:ubiquinone oxidoreductase subunit E
MSNKLEMQICLGSSCFSRGNKEMVLFIKEYLRKNHLEDKVLFKGARCLDLCSSGPNLVINGKIIQGISLSMVEKILDQELEDIR